MCQNYLYRIPHRFWNMYRMFREVNDVTLLAIHFKADRSITLQNVWTRQKVIRSTCLHVMLLYTGVQKKTVLFKFSLFKEFSRRFTSFLEKTLNSNQKSLIDPWRRTMPMLFPVFVVISGWELLTASGWVTSPSQVISLRKLVPNFS